MRDYNIWKESNSKIAQKKKEKIIQTVGSDLNEAQIRMLEIGFEDRENQERIMWDIVEALEYNENQLIEASVGIGKSLAYLIPGILLSYYTGKPLIVVTSTIHLSEQLENDIEIVKKILAPIIDDSSIDIVVGKGRTNYPCSSKIKSEISKYRKKNNHQMLEVYRNILKQVDKGADLQNKMGIPDKYWNSITRHTCHNSSYGREECPYHKMRRSLKVSQKYKDSSYINGMRVYTPKVLIVNQDLLMAHINNKRNNISHILPDDFPLLIIDEVHNLEVKARDSLTVTINWVFIERLFINLEKISSRSDFKSKRIKKIHELKNKSKNYFKELEKNLEQEAKDIRYEDNLNSLFIKKPSILFEDLGDQLLDLLTSIEIDTISESFLLNNNDKAFEQAEEDLRQLVYFIESSYNKKNNVIIWGDIINNKINLNYCPAEISKVLKESIFNQSFITIGLSATITNIKNGKPSYDYIKKYIGFSGEDREPKYSNFLYENSRLYIPKNLPNYNFREDAYFDSISQKIYKITENTNGGSLVLFTSKNDLNAVYERLKNKKMLMPIYVGLRSEESKNIILNHKERRGVILGTGTFWEGLDLKGEYLTNLIIVRLPYPVPSPILEHKVKTSSFEEVYDPEMITKLRQGTGRLIRSRSDIGVCTILDSRMNIEDNRSDLIFKSLPFKEVLSDYDELKVFQKENKL